MNEDTRLIDALDCFNKMLKIEMRRLEVENKTPEAVIELIKQKICQLETHIAHKTELLAEIGSGLSEDLQQKKVLARALKKLTPSDETDEDYQDDDCCEGPCCA